MKTKWEFLKSTYTRGQVNLTAAIVTNVFKNIEEHRKLLVSAYPEPYGGYVRGFGSIFQPSAYDVPGSQAYYYKAFYYGYRCNRSRDEMVTDKNYISPSFASIQVNSLDGVCKEIGFNFELNGKPVKLFKLAHRINEADGILSFKPFSDVPTSIRLLTHDGKLPYRFITREEYFSILKNYWEKEKKKSETVVDDGEKQILRLIETTKKDFTGDMREKMLKELDTQLKQYRSTMETQKAKLAAGMKLQLDAIESGLRSQAAEDLKKPAIPVSEIVYNGFTTEEDGGNYLVMIDESYFKRNLPAHAAQFFLVQWDYQETDPGGIYWMKAIRDKFPFDKLKSLLDK